jgi:hypothetical protein
MDSAGARPLRVAAVFDAVGEAGRPYFSADRRRVLDAGERAALAGYLESAPLVVRASGFEVDPLDPDAGRVVPLGYHTDGVWVWQEASAYYLRTRGVAPDDALVEHAASVGHRAPESVPGDVADAAAELALSPSPPRLVTGRRAATYFGSVKAGFPAEDPAGLLRQWYDEEGHRIDEMLPRGMRWKFTPAFLVNDRNGEADYEEIPAWVAADIVDRWWADWRVEAGRTGQIR